MKAVAFLPGSQDREPTFESSGAATSCFTVTLNVKHSDAGVFTIVPGAETAL
jgi:hypothetical protein